MLLEEVMQELEAMGSASTRKIYDNHGARGPGFGVKVGDMKKILKKTKKDHALALSLYETGNTDAMYLAGLMGDARKVTSQELDHWAKTATFYMVTEYAVAGLAAESPHGWDLALQWIDAPEDHVSSAGWATLGGLVSVRDDQDLDLDVLSQLMQRVVQTLAQAPNRTRYTMNGFIIGVGCYIAPLLEKANAAAEAIGKVNVDMGGTRCKVPMATDYIKKVVDMGRLGKKRKKVRC